MDLDAIERLGHKELAELAYLLDQQEEAYSERSLDLYEPHPGQLAFHKSNAKIRVVVTSNRWGKCLTNRTLIESPYSKPRAIGNIKGHHWVWAWDGKRKIPVLAELPFKKPPEECFRVWMSDGSWFECAGNHRVLTEAGWQFFSRIAEFFPCLPPSSSGHGLLAHVEDVRHWLRKQRDLKHDYSQGFRRYGERLLPGPNTAQVFSPFLSDVPRRSLVRWLVDALANKYRHISHALSARLSNMGVQPHFAVQSAGFSNQASRKLFELGIDDIPSSQQPSNVEDIFSQLKILTSRHLDASLAALVSPDINGNSIIAYQPIGRHDIYDFHVPVYQNYCTAGVIHHNSTASVVEACKLALGVHEYHPIPVPNKGKIYGESFPAIDEYLKPKFEKWLPKKFLSAKKPYTFSQHGHLIGVNFANGSRIVLNAYAQQEATSESSDWDFVGFDEPPTRELYVANLRGLVDREGLMWFTCTPLSEPWIFDDLWQPGIHGTKPEVECFGGSIYDNTHISERGRDLFISELTEQEKEVRVYGKFSTLKGLVIDTYSPFTCDIEPFQLNHNFTIYEGIDPGPGKAHAALWKAIDREGRRFVVGEVECPDGIHVFGQMIAQKRRELRAHGAELARSVSDTSLNQSDPNFRQNMRDNLIASLREAGETVMPQNAQKRDWLMPGIEKLRDLYRPVPQIIQGYEIKAPMQFVFNTCKLYKDNLTHYLWPKNKPITDNMLPVPIKNDYIDCDRYIESVAPAYQTPGQSGIVRTFNNAYSRIAAPQRPSAFYRGDLSSPSPVKIRDISTPQRQQPQDYPSSISYRKNYSFRGIK